MVRTIFVASSSCGIAKINWSFLSTREQQSASSHTRLNPQLSPPLSDANGSPIDTYGNKSLKLNIDMRRNYIWSFIIANVQTPILGAYFLANYNLAVHMNSRAEEGIWPDATWWHYSTVRQSICFSIIPGSQTWEHWFQDLCELQTPKCVNHPGPIHLTSTTSCPDYKAFHLIPVA